MNNKQQLHLFEDAKTTGAQGQLVEISNKRRENSGGGEPPMDKDKYVTHEELDHAVNNIGSEVKLSTEKMSHNMDNHFAEIQKQIDKKFNEVDKRIDQANSQYSQNFEKINTKFESQKVWFYGTGIVIVSVTCTVIGFLIKFIK